LEEIFSEVFCKCTTASGKANHEPIMIELDREGCPLVPVIADYSQHHAKVIQGAVRDFLTLHLKFVTGHKNLAISWSALKKDQFAWLQEDSLLTDLQLQDPSKMSKDDVQRLLDYWYEQEEAGIQPVEWKSTCPLLRDEPPRVSNIPRPVPRAQEPEAPYHHPSSLLMCWSQILTVLPLVEVLGASIANRSNEGSFNTRGGPSSITAATSRSKRRPNVAAIEEDDGKPVVHERGSGGGSVPAMALSTSTSRPKRNTMLTEKASNPDRGRGAGRVPNDFLSGGV
ncbi:hypothetical protein BC834DRAFT_848706, partial [Gloeopeniophorella convolvens]